MTDFPHLLALLVNAGVEFIVIGGFAATAHGSVFLTVDLDLVYRRSDDNLIRLARAVEPIHPYLRVHKYYQTDRLRPIYEFDGAPLFIMTSD